MSSSIGHINYAKFIGFHSVAAAIVFAVLYLIFFGWFVKQSFVIPTRVHYSLVFFCLIRVVAFVIRAILAGSESAGVNLGLLIADLVLFGVGFFGLLFTAYTLVMDLALLSDHPKPRSPWLRFTQDRRLFRISLTIAVALGTASSSMMSSNFSHPSTTSSILRKVSTILFLTLTVLQAVMTVWLSRLEIAEPEKYKRASVHFGMRHGIFILLAISLLLLIREIFTTATMSNFTKQNNEHFWYPLIAVPEILAVILYASPGLVPSRADLAAAEERRSGLPR